MSVNEPQENTSPLVSVVIPSYNRAQYIPATLDSVLAQSFEDFEIVFVDDGSTDETKSILDSYIQKDPRVRYIWQENSERAVARTNGINNSQGKYVCLVDSDDLWYPDKLAKQVKTMEENSWVVFSYASVNRIDFDNNKLPIASRQHDGFSGNVFEKLLMRNFIPSVTPMFLREVALRVGSQNSDFIPYEDWDFWLRISREGEFYHIKEPLGDYRIHADQSVQNVNAEKIEEVTIKVLNANCPWKPDGGSLGEDLNTDQVLVCKQAYSLAYLRIAYWYILAGKPEIAREKLAKSLGLAEGMGRFDPRIYALYLSSFSGGLLNKFLLAFH